MIKTHYRVQNQHGRAVGDLVSTGKETLTLARYNELADVPPELEWLANIANRKTLRFYKSDVEEFSRFTGLRAPAELRNVARMSSPGANHLKTGT